MAAAGCRQGALHRWLLLSCSCCGKESLAVMPRCKHVPGRVGERLLLFSAKKEGNGSFLRLLLSTLRSFCSGCCKGKANT